MTIPHRPILERTTDPDHPAGGNRRTLAIPTTHADVGEITEHEVACRRCGLLVYVFLDDNDNPVYEHTLPWKHHDHPVDPVPARAILQRLQRVCDFCEAPDPVSLYIAPRIAERSMLANGQIDEVVFSADWRICAVCERLARNRAYDKIYDRMRVTSVIHQRHHTNDTPEAITRDRQRYTGLWASVVEQWRFDSVLKPYKPPKPITATQVPKVCDRLVTYLRSDEFTADFVLSGKDKEILYPTHLLPNGYPFDAGVFLSDPTPDEGARYGHDLASHLADAPLFHISPEFTALAARRAQRLYDLDISRVELPRQARAGTEDDACTSGFVVWQAPILTVGPQDAEVIAASWHEVPDHGLWICFYIRTTELWVTHDPDAVRASRGYLAPGNFGAPIFWAQRGDSKPDTPIDWQGGNILLGTLIGTWLLMRSPGIAEVTTPPIDRKTQRKAARSGFTPRTVRLVDIRRQPANPGRRRTTGEPTRNYTCRWPVGFDTGGFDRTYWIGPGRTIRDRKTIEPYWAGPEGLPPKTTKKVTRLR